MPVTGPAQERKDSPQGTFELGKHSFIRKFLVQTNDINDGPIQVASAIGIPKMFQLYTTPTEYHFYARVRNIECARIEKGSMYWEVTVHYETPEERSSTTGGTSGSNGENAAQNDNPLLCIPDMGWETEKMKIPIYGVYSLTDDGDLQLKPVKATNDEIFNPPPQKDNGRLILNITRNEPLSFDHPNTSILFTDAVNSDVFWGAPAGQCKCQSIVPKKMVKQQSSGATFTYLQVVYKFEFMPTWDLLILNAGNYYYIDPISMLVPPPKRRTQKFLTDDGHPRQGLLAADGTKLADGATPLFISVRPYPRRPFSLLNLPQSFIDSV